MGMFDSFIDRVGNDFQTKALGRTLQEFHLGDEVIFPIPDFQLEVLGEKDRSYFYTLVTICSGKFVAIDVPRDETLPLIDYLGARISTDRKFPHS